MIISKLRKHPVTFNELADFLQRESEFHDFNVTKGKRTIQRDFDDIRSIYNIDIRFDFRQGVYVLEPDENQEKNLRMVEALDLFNAMKVTIQTHSINIEMDTLKFIVLKLNEMLEAEQFDCEQFEFYTIYLKRNTISKYS